MFLRFLVLLVTSLLVLAAQKQTRIYVRQFPENSEHLVLPKMVFMAVFMGKMHYSYFQMTLESMRWNPQVDFVAINIIEDGSSDSNHLLELSQHIPNFKVVVLSMTQWRARIKERLDLDVPFNKTWYYKLCEYKPTLAYLFPEIANKKNATGGLLYKYWGYGDLDVIWGNFSRWAHWFQEDPKYPFMISGYFGTTGALAMYLNEPWTQGLFLTDPVYKNALKDFAYHNLDEGGVQVNPADIIDDGKHSISVIQKTHVNQNNKKYHFGAVYEDRVLLDGSDTDSWAGPVIWAHGTLKIPQSSNLFPHGREVLLFHRPPKLEFPAEVKHGLIQDMKVNGFVIPDFIPLMSRYICARNVVRASKVVGVMENIYNYQPYNQSCFGKMMKWDGTQHVEHVPEDQLRDTGKSLRVYSQQFPINNEHLMLPKMLLMFVYMGKVQYQFIELTLESMRWNDQVDFVLINIIEDGTDDAADIVELSNAVSNFNVVVLSMTQWRARVKERLDLDVPFNNTWYYKMCEYKPTLAYLFPEIANKKTATGGLLYKYWGYGDLDVIWGNFSRWAHWFQEDPKYPFIISGHFSTTGALAMYLNEPWTQELFLRDPVYKKSLNDFHYRNLDEGGIQTKPGLVIDNGEHSISKLQKDHCTVNGTLLHYGVIPEDRVLVDGQDTKGWAGPVSWIKGSLKLPQASNFFPAGREILLFHRPNANFNVPDKFHKGLIQDMIEYGYILPDFIPLVTRYMCTDGVTYHKPIMESAYLYTPYSEKCFGKMIKHDNLPQQTDDVL